MDLGYWGFRRWPFERSFAVDRFFSSAIHDEALARLLFLVEEFGRTGIVTGAAGTGKSLLLKILQQRAARLGRLTVCCEAMGLEGHELISQVAVGCHVQCDTESSPARIWNGLRARFAALTLIHQPLVIVIDHFDQVDFSCQQTVLRLRQNADSLGLKLTIIVATRDCVVPAALQETIDLRIEMTPWTAVETSEFITSAMTQAGVSQVVFTDEALNTIYDSTSGVPSNVVSLCNLALLAAMGRDQTLITSEVVEAAVHELPGRPGDQRLKQQLTTSDMAS